jgi:hypothetical protein
MRRAFVLLSLILLSGCGNSWIGQTSEAREQPRLEPLRVEDIARDTLRCPTAIARSSLRSSATAAVDRRNR